MHPRQVGDGSCPNFQPSNHQPTHLISSILTPMLSHLPGINWLDWGNNNAIESYSRVAKNPSDHNLIIQHLYYLQGATATTSLARRLCPLRTLLRALSHDLTMECVRGYLRARHRSLGSNQLCTFDSEAGVKSQLISAYIQCTWRGGASL